MSNLKYWLWLADRKGLAGQTGVRVLNYFGSPERVYFSDAKEYRMVGGLSEIALHSLADKSMDRPNRILGDCDRLGIRILTLQDAVYPERLAAIAQPPMVLYMKGRPVAFDEEAAVAIVGTRDATPYGIDIAGRLSMELTRSGALIVSGMAEGIDTAAVKGALAAGGPVVSVLAGGLDVIYPRRNRQLYEDVSVAGTLISEQPPGTEPRGQLFPVRNRIISGLSVGVIAVESKRAGGTLYTVGHALDQNREVFAVPGPVGAVCSEGTNRLIQEGAAKLIMGAEDVLCELQDRFPGRLRRKAPLEPETAEQRLRQAVKETAPERPAEETHAEKVVDNSTSAEYINWQDCKMKLTDDQQTVLLAFGEKAFRADDLVELTQLPARQVLSALTILQVQGYVTEESGKRFRAAVKLKME
ncbi:MAG: DNA-processing protein DprA [Candidatus Enterenecus sp.]